MKWRECVFWIVGYVSGHILCDVGASTWNATLVQLSLIWSILLLSWAVRRIVSAKEDHE